MKGFVLASVIFGCYLMASEMAYKDEVKPEMTSAECKQYQDGQKQLAKAVDWYKKNLNQVASER